MAETTTATSLPALDLALHAAGDVADAIEVGDRGAAELHHDAGLAVSHRRVCSGSLHGAPVARRRDGGHA
jgi:hypothetical protein